VKLGDYARIRTGLVLSRKEATEEPALRQYTALTLKALTEDGWIDREMTEPYDAATILKREYFTHEGDILLRLSAPYTAVLILKENEDLLVSSHFAIIRANGRRVAPYYLHWWLSQGRKRFYKQASGASMMGTISSGYISDMDFMPPQIDVQRQMGKLLQLSYREQELLDQLRTKKAMLVNAALNQIIKPTGGQK
jgi:hypothetical protein